MILPRSLDYIFQLAVEMKKLGLPWTKGKLGSGG
jgi:hypothetical protein